MANHRNAVSLVSRSQNVGSITACNAGASRPLRKKITAAARLLQPLRCPATRLKIIQRSLQHASNTVTHHTQALTRQAQCRARYGRRRRTCTFLTRPRVTRSIIHAAKRPVVLKIENIPAGAVVIRRHAVATKPNMKRTSTHGEICVSM